MSKELVDFLHYIEKNDESAEAADSHRIRLIHECVRKIKSSEEMGVKFMQSWCETAQCSGKVYSGMSLTFGFGALDNMSVYL